MILIRAGNAYLDIFFDKTVTVPWGKPCARLEGGAYTLEPFPGMPVPEEEPGCDIGIPDNVQIVGRSYLVDQEMGVVNIFCRFGDAVKGMPDSHTFRLQGVLSLAHPHRIIQFIDHADKFLMLPVNLRCVYAECIAPGNKRHLKPPMMLQG